MNVSITKKKNNNNKIFKSYKKIKNAMSTIFSQ